MVNTAVLWWCITLSCKFFLLFPLIFLNVKCTSKCKMFPTPGNRREEAVLVSHIFPFKEQNMRLYTSVTVRVGVSLGLSFVRNYISGCE